MNASQHSHSDIMKIYEWVDSMALSKKKKNIKRDFSDGVLMAEILKINYPALVNINNYAETYSIQKKIYNWSTLNDKVLKRLQIPISDKEMIALANAEAGAIEKVLMKAYSIIHNHNHNKDEGPLLIDDSDRFDHSSNHKHKTAEDVTDYKAIIFQKEVEIFELKKRFRDINNEIVKKELENKALALK